MNIKKILLIIILVLAFLTAAVYFLFPIFGSGTFSKEGTLQHYLEYIQTGDFKKAAELDGTKVDEFILADEFVKNKENRISSFSINSWSGNLADVSFSLSGESITEQILVNEAPRKFFIIPSWKVINALQEQFEVTIPGNNTIDINSVEYKTESSSKLTTDKRVQEKSFQFTAYPAVYNIEGHSLKRWYQPTSKQLKFVQSDKYEQKGNESFYQIELKPTDELIETVQKNSDELINDCSKSAKEFSDTCPLRISSAQASTTQYRSIQYSVSKLPVIQVYYDVDQFVFETETAGNYKAVYEYANQGETSSWLKADRENNGLKNQGVVLIDQNNAVSIKFLSNIHEIYKTDKEN